MRKSKLRVKAWTLLAVLTAGGTLFGTCELRLRSALIDGSKSMLFGLLDPSNFSSLFTTDTGDEADEGGN